MNRLDHVGGRAGLECLVDVPRIVVRGEDDHGESGDPPKRLVKALESVHLTRRSPDLQDECAGLVALEEIEGPRRRVGLSDDLDARLLQNLDDRVEPEWVLIEQDGRKCCH